MSNLTINTVLTSNTTPIIANVSSGARGKSAYESWIDEGNVGTEEDFVAWLNQAEVHMIAAAVSETNAALSASSALTYKTETQQAMSDYLAMLGVDVATLTNGKLSPSQIPSIAINDTFPVADTSEITALTAQKGDVAIVVANDVVTDSYILAADDAAVLSNWKKLGVSYVAEAGHATTATSAENADKINNKRIISMTQAQYDAAVKDPDTIYIVAG